MPIIGRMMNQELNGQLVAGLSEPKQLITLEDIQSYICSQSNVDDLEQIEQTIEISCEDTARTALSMALQVRKIEKSLEDTKKEITRPHLDFQKAVNKIVNGIKGKLTSIENSLTAKLEIWVEKCKDDFFECNHLKVDDGAMSSVEEWNYEIDNDQLIPGKYLKPDAEAIELAIKQGIRNIPGISIYKSKKLNLRVKN